MRIKAIIENTVKVVHACGIPCPKVAPLAAVEVVNPKMPVTVDAAELTKMNENGEITGCIVDGPLSLDLAIDPEAAKHKEQKTVRSLVMQISSYSRISTPETLYTSA